MAANGASLGVGVVGASLSRGWASSVHLPGLEGLPEFEVAAVCTTRAESARETSMRFGGRPYTDPLALMQDPNVDIVTVCVRAPLHYDLVRAALEAGKHVLCEWPLVPTSDQAEELRKLAEAHGVRHAAGLQGRYSPVIAQAKHLISSGYIGEFISCTVRFGVHTNGGWVDPARKYMADKNSGGGLLYLHGGHIMDTVQHCLGEFASVSATLAVGHPEVRVGGTEEVIPRTAPDQILVNVEFQEGAVGSLHIQGGKQSGGGFVCQIQGTEGDLELATTGNHAVQVELLELRGARPSHEYKHHEVARHTHQPLPQLELIPLESRFWDVPESVRVQPLFNTAALYRAFGRDIREGSLSVPDFALSRRRLALFETIVESAETGRRLQAPE